MNLASLTLTRTRTRITLTLTRSLALALTWYSSMNVASAAKEQTIGPRAYISRCIAAAPETPPYSFTPYRTPGSTAKHPFEV